jgi:hypothetical protein
VLAAGSAYPTTCICAPFARKGRRFPFRVKGGCGRQADGTAGLTPAPEIPRAARHLRFVPGSDMRSLSCAAYDPCSNGHTSTTPCATAQGVCDTMSMASAKLAASIIAKPANGNEDVMNGPFVVST